MNYLEIYFRTIPGTEKLKGIDPMPPLVKLLIRSALSLGLGIILSHWFFQRTSYPGIIGLTVFFLGMSYLSEYIRKRG